jgi:hypothetical protein
MLECTINFSGATLEDCESAIEEALKQIRETFTSGANRNDTGSYSFSVSGEPSLRYACNLCNDNVFAERSEDPKGDIDPRLAEHLSAAHGMDDPGEPADYFSLRD